MAVTDRDGLPCAISVHSASRHEVKLVTEVLKKRFTFEYPRYIVGDKAYDSDPLDLHLEQKYNVHLIAPHKKNRRKPSTQDAYELRTYYSKRWKVERFFGWLEGFRRIQKRYDYYTMNFLGFVQLASVFILLRNFFG